MSQIEAGTQDVSLLVVGDSTGTCDQLVSRVTRLPQALADRFSTHTIEFREWDYVTSVSTAGFQWKTSGPTTIPRSGARKIKLWLAGAPGRNWRHFFETQRREPIFTAAAKTRWSSPSGTTTTARPCPCSALAPATSRSSSGPGPSSRRPKRCCPRRTPGLQPQPAPLRNELRNALYRQIARERGYGHVNAMQAFYDDGRPIADTLLDAAACTPPTRAPTCGSPKS